MSNNNEFVPGSAEYIARKLQLIKEAMSGVPNEQQMLLSPTILENMQETMGFRTREELITWFEENGYKPARQTLH